MVPLCQTTLPFPCATHGSILPLLSSVIAWEGYCPSEGREKWLYPGAAAHPVCAFVVLQVQVCLWWGSGHLLHSCLGGPSLASTMVTEALIGGMDFNHYPFLVHYCCKDAEFLNEVLWSVKYKVRKI